MQSITIITIVVVALLTVIILGLTWVAYSSCIKAYKLEVSQGKHDEEIYTEYSSKKKHKGGLAGTIGSYVILSLLLALFTTGIVYKARGENLSINNQTALVIKTGSMSDFYDDEIAKKYNYDVSLQFDVGDICIFEKVSPESELIEGEVYGYKRKNNIITHRLINVQDGLYEFRGDNNPVSDGLRINKEDIIYHYVGKKVQGVGSFILYAQSIFGMWSLLGIIGVAICSEIVYHKIDKINKERNNLIPDKNLPDQELSEIDLTNDTFGRAVAFILDLKDEAVTIEESAYEKAVKEIWPQLGGENHEK